ncbi:MAG: hypothetical protein ABGZ53_19775 [Fuerstiella sp.]
MALAISNAPCVRAVKVDYATETATIGTDADTPLSKQEIRNVLSSTQYRVAFEDESPAKDVDSVLQ